MEGKITGEDDENIGLHVLDNNGAKHRIEMRKADGDIYAHQSEAYHDEAAKRTPEENEYSEQARRFAQYYVFVEEGYDTVSPEIHPERINAVRHALRDLSDAEFADLFSDLKQQLRSYHDDGIDRAIPIPADAAGPKSVYYRQHVYLGVDPLETELAAEAKSLAEEYGIDLDDVTDSPVGEMSRSTVSNWQAFSEEFADLACAEGVDLTDDLDIDAVSSLYTAYVDDQGAEHFGEPARDPFDRDPDTLIELAPIEPGPLDEFRAYFDHYLKCQIRDCFVRMGLHPPDEFSVLGPGRIEAAEQYKRLEMYPDFTDPHNERLLAG